MPDVAATLTDARARLTASRLGKSIMREMDQDILIIRRLVEALEAHTPTDDERETLASMLRDVQADRSLGRLPWEDYPFKDVHRENADYLIARGVGFRRSVSPEPITEDAINAERERQIAKGYTPEHDRRHGVAHVLRWVLHYGSRGEHLKAYAMVEAALEIAPPDPGLNTGWLGDQVAARHIVDDENWPEPQAEPSDDMSIPGPSENVRGPATSERLSQLEVALEITEAVLMQSEPSAAPTVQFFARRAGKSQALIESMLEQANERGIRVEVVYPQVEPSDAQVDAAGDLLYGVSWGTDIADPELVRASLRAAAAVPGHHVDVHDDPAVVTKQGENRG